MAVNTPKVLILFFSRTGTTRLLAEAIARATQGDVEELHERRSRRGLFGWIRSGYEGTYKRSAATLPLRHRPQDYDLVFVGSPTWNQALCSPVRGFLRAHGRELPEVALFATCAGRGAEAVIHEMAEFLARPPLATLALLEKVVRHSPSEWVGDFTERALTAWERSAAARGVRRLA